MGLWDSIKDIGGKIVGGIGDAVSSIPKGIVSTGLNLAGNFLGDQLIGDPNSADAYKRQKAFYQNRYQWMMEDMQKAGLNPILAAGSAGFSTSGTPSVAMSTLPQTDYASSAKSYSEIEKINEEATTERVRQLKTMAEAYTEIWRRYQVRFDAMRTQAEETKLLTESQKNYKSMQELVSRTELNQEQTELLRKNIQVIQTSLNKLQNISDVYSHGASKILTILKEITGAIGLSTSAGAHQTGSSAIIRVIK